MYKCRFSSQNRGGADEREGGGGGSFIFRGEHYFRVCIYFGYFLSQLVHTQRMHAVP